MATAYEQLVQRIIVGHPTDTAAEMLRLLDKTVQDGQRLVLTDEEAARGVKADLGLGWERVSDDGGPVVHPVYSDQEDNEFLGEADPSDPDDWSNQ